MNENCKTPLETRYDQALVSVIGFEWRLKFYIKAQTPSNVIDDAEPRILRNFEINWNSLGIILGIISDFLSSHQIVLPPNLLTKPCMKNAGLTQPLRSRSW